MGGTKGKRISRRTKAFAYLRVSGKGQVEGHGFARQQEAITKYARKARIQVVDVFQEKGVSGTTGRSKKSDREIDLEHRPALSELERQIKLDGVRTVLIERADRLARDLMVSELLLERFRKDGVAVIAVDSGNDLTVADDDPTRTLIRHVLGAVSQFEKTTLKLKLEAARVKKRRTATPSKLDNACEGQKPFGYYDGELETLARMQLLRRLHSGRISFEKIARLLNDEGRSSRSGKPWRGVSVKQILQRVGLRPVEA